MQQCNVFCRCSAGCSKRMFPAGRSQRAVACSGASYAPMASALTRYTVKAQRGGLQVQNQRLQSLRPPLIHNRLKSTVDASSRTSSLLLALAHDAHVVLPVDGGALCLAQVVKTACEYDVQRVNQGIRRRRQLQRRHVCRRLRKEDRVPCERLFFCSAGFPVCLSRSCFQQQLPKDANISVACEASQTCRRSRPSRRLPASVVSFTPAP